MKAARSASPSACARAMRSIVALHPCLPETTTQGAEARRAETRTEEIDLSPVAFFHQRARPL
jgi:hypothetical protein